MGRTPCCDKSKVKRGPWSPEEDSILKNYLQTHGCVSNWIALPSKAGLKRCGKSCRLRWLNYLRPDIKHGAFTEEEDNIIINLYNTIGSRWSVIASHLQGRTDNDVKNYWNTKMKKKLAGKCNNHNNSSTNDNVPFVNSYNGVPCFMDMNNYRSFSTFPACETKVEETESSVTISSSFQENDSSVRLLAAENVGCGGDDEFLFGSGSGSCPAVSAADVDDLLDGFDFVEEMINSTNEMGSAGFVDIMSSNVNTQQGWFY